LLLTILIGKKLSKEEKIYRESNSASLIENWCILMR